MSPIWTRAFTLAVAATFAVFVGFYLLIPALPPYAAQLGASKSAIGIVIGIYSIAAVTVRLTTGHLIDRGGRKRFLMSGLALFAAASVSYRFATTLSSPARSHTGERRIVNPSAVSTTSLSPPASSWATAAATLGSRRSRATHPMRPWYARVADSEWASASSPKSAPAAAWDRSSSARRRTASRSAPSGTRSRMLRAAPCSTNEPAW